jgi:hypothetical protein
VFLFNPEKTKDAESWQYRGGKKKSKLINN